MAVTRNGYLLLGIIAFLLIISGVVVMINPSPSPFTSGIRFAGLAGFILLAVASIMIAWSREIYRNFGTSFVNFHHIFAVSGLVMITLHPVLLAIRLMNVSVFLLRFDSFQEFLLIAGRPALFLIYIAVTGVLLRRFIPMYWREVHALIWIALLLGLFGLALVALFFLPFFGKFLGAFPSKGFLDKLKKKIILLRETILHYRTQKGPFLRATFWAVLLQLNVILYYFLIGKALHLRIHFLDYFIFIPIVLLIQSIPITINGLGLREGSYIEIFRFYGIGPQTAVSFSLIADVAFVLILGLIGGIIYVSRK